MVDKEKLSDKVTFEQSPGESESSCQSSGENSKCKAPGVWRAWPEEVSQIHRRKRRSGNSKGRLCMP